MGRESGRAMGRNCEWAKERWGEGRLSQSNFMQMLTLENPTTIRVLVYSAKALRKVKEIAL